MTENRRRTPAEYRLIRAAKSGLGIEPLVRALDSGADLNVRGEIGETPLQTAVIEARIPCARLLLERGADPDSRCDYGRTALHEAAQHRQPDCTALLLEYGADPNIRDKQDCTPLHMVAMRDLHDHACLLLEHGADLGARDRGGETPLHVAAFWGTTGGCVRLFLEHGADPNARDQNGLTPLHRAARGGGARVRAPAAGARRGPECPGRRRRIPAARRGLERTDRVRPDAHGARCGP